MIYTVTFNPALDYVVHMNDELEIGSVNRSSSEKFYYGGKGINVSTVLNHLGNDNIALGFVAGFTGMAIENGLKVQGISTDFIHLENGISRINVKIKSRQETDLNAQGPIITDIEKNRLFHKLNALQEGDILVLAGSIPNTLPDTIYERILSMLYDKDIMFVVDATKNLILNVLKYHPFLIKPNIHELKEMFNQDIKTDEDIIQYAYKLQESGARNVLISMAEQGAILITETKECLRINAPKGIIKNSVGAGDSMVAGFLSGYLRNSNYETALKLGLAAGSATAFCEGLADRDSIYELYNSL